MKRQVWNSLEQVLQLMFLSNLWMQNETAVCYNGNTLMKIYEG